MTRVLSYGAHSPGDRACVVEAARLAVGEPWNDLSDDDPASCIGPACASYARTLNDAYSYGYEADARRTAALTPLVALLSGTRAVESAMRWVWVDLALASAAEAVESYGGDASAMRACIPVQDAEAAARAARAASMAAAAARAAEATRSAWAAADAAAEAADAAEEGPVAWAVAAKSAAWASAAAEAAADSDRYASLDRAAAWASAAAEAAADSDRYASLDRAASRFIAALERLHAEHSEVTR